MRRKIEIDAKGKAEIAKHFGVTVANVGLALLYKRNSLQCERIRQMALAKGGKLLKIEEETPKQTIKVLDTKGNVKEIINQ